MNREGDPEERHRGELHVLILHNIIPRGLISDIPDEHSAETFNAVVVPNSRGSLLHASLPHSDRTCWGVHTRLGPLCSEARLRMYFLLRQFKQRLLLLCVLTQPSSQIQQGARGVASLLLDEEAQALEVWFAQGQI